MLSRIQIEEVIGPVYVGGGAESPGQHALHYSPKTRLVLGPAPNEGKGAELDVGAMPGNPLAWGERLYAILHELDGQGHDWIAIELPPDTPEWAGIRDRLRRAAGK